jgi:hypothetical protein
VYQAFLFCQSNKQEAVMPVTLEEYKRSSQQMTPTLAGVITIFQDNAPILGQGRNFGYPLPALGFENTVGGVASFVRERTLPTTGFRAINQHFEASTGATELVSENLSIAGGKVVYDRVLRKRSGEDGVITQMTMQISSMARMWNQCFYNGLTSDPNAFTGLATRITGKQVYDAGGAGLNLRQLDEAILHWRGENRVIVMGSAMAAIIFQAARNSNNVMYTPATFGQSPATYNGIPIMLAGETSDESDVLDFTESDDTTSIYLLSLGDNGVVGVQTQPLDAYHTEDKVDSDIQIEWDASFIIKSLRSAIRIKGIANEPIVSTATFASAAATSAEF